MLLHHLHYSLQCREVQLNDFPQSIMIVLNISASSASLLCFSRRYFNTHGCTCVTPIIRIICNSHTESSLRLLSSSPNDKPCILAWGLSDMLAMARRLNEHIQFNNVPDVPVPSIISDVARGYMACVPLWKRRIVDGALWMGQD